MKPSWTYGNEVRLLESGEEYFPALLQALQHAKSEIYFEVYIFEDCPIGRSIAKELKTAAQRGVKVNLVIDGFGSSRLPAEFIADLQTAKVNVVLFNKLTHFFQFLSRNFYRRLHRKVVSIDGKVALIGGINVAQDQFASTGKRGRLDFAVIIKGPCAERIQHRSILFFSALTQNWEIYFWRRLKKFKKQKSGPPTKAAFIQRDNFRRRREIESAYLTSIHDAQNEILISNAYFFPRYRLQRAIFQAAKRGVRVRIMVQGEIDFLTIKWATESLYRSFLKKGIEIYEYKPRLLHAKVAAIDDYWATVGSCNLEPLSSFLNLEANVLIDNKDFNSKLRSNLESIFEKDCQKIGLQSYREPLFKSLLIRTIVFCYRFLPRFIRDDQPQMKFPF